MRNSIRATKILLVSFAYAEIVIAIRLFSRTALDPVAEYWRTCSSWCLLGAGFLLLWTVRSCRTHLISSWVFWRRLIVGWLLIFAFVVAGFGEESLSESLLIVLTAAWLLLLSNSFTELPHAGKWSLVADMAATNVALFIVLGEFALRMHAAISGNSLLIRDTIDAYRLLPNHNYGRLWTNSYGYPSREFYVERIPGVQRIAVIGDSFVVGGVRQDVNYPSLIEKAIPSIEVYSFGVSAIDPRGYLEILRTEAFHFKPEIVLVSFFVGNDVLAGLPDQDLLRAEKYCLYLFFKRCGKLIREWSRKRDDNFTGVLELQDPPILEKGYHLSRKTHLDIEFERLQLCRRSLQGSKEACWLETFHYLSKIQDACEQHSVRFGILIIPDEFQVNRLLLREVLDHGRIPPNDLDLLVDQF